MWVGVFSSMRLVLVLGVIMLMLLWCSVFVLFVVVV